MFRVLNVIMEFLIIWMLFKCKKEFITAFFLLGMFMNRINSFIVEGVRTIFAIFRSKESYADEAEVVEAVFVDEDDQTVESSLSFFERIDQACYRFVLNLLDKDSQAEVISFLEYVAVGSYDEKYIQRLVAISED